MLRQVRLLAAPALVSMGLGLVILLGMSYTSDWRVVTASPADIALALVAIVAPWLIAVAAIAPDAESGGLAFLGGLPLGRARHFALRALVALGWSIVAVTPFVALVAREFPGHQLADDLARALLPGVLAFVAGLAAGAVARQSLGAFIAAPLLVGVPVGLYEAFVYAMRAPADYFMAGPVVACALLLVAGWLGFRDPAVGPSWRPLLRTSGLLLGAVVLGCGVTTAAWAHAVVFPERDEAWSAQGPLVAHHVARRADWPGARNDWETALYPAAGLEGVTTLEALGEGWSFDDGLRLLASTPEGHVLAHASSSPGRLMLLDVLNRKVLVAEDEARLTWAYTYAGAPLPEQTSVEGEPWLVTGDGDVKTFTGRLLHRLPEGLQLHATGGARLLGFFPDGERIVFDVSTGAQTSVGQSSDRGHVLLSPRGRYLLRWTQDSLEPRLTFVDLDEGRQVTVPFPAGHPGWLQNVTTAFSPNDRSAVVYWSVSVTKPFHEDGASTVEHQVAVDLAAGVVTELSSAAYWSVHGWSPSGRRALVDDGWVDLDVAPEVVRKLPTPAGPLRRFVDEDTLLWTTPDGEVERLELTASE
jgi:hypothetical protein